jgi:amylosucrase
MTHVLDGMPAVPPGAGWVTYVRCHDDIGWTITPEDAVAVGEDAHLHRRFLSDFYAGDFPGSFARGARFQPDEASGEARTSGMTASLAGLESAGDDELARELAIRRVLLLHAVAFAHGGLPLIYMGDELGLLNDPAWADDVHQREDNRWMHRPPMDWAAAERRHVPGAVEYEIWDGLQRLIAARRSTRATHGYGAGQPLWTGNDHVYGLLRSFAGERLLVLANFSSDEQRVRGAILDEHRMELTAAATVPDGRPARSDGDDVVLAPYQFLWIRG